jgi:A/G-specific adenine glycosylase
VKYKDFQELVWEKGRELYRPMPWRDDTRAYFVLVSELMLQQTQVERVVPKFQAFIGAFPDIQALARASLGEVLALWSGLGYNRRAKYLHAAARAVVRDHSGEIPLSYEELVSLPGVGPNTAGAILTYSGNQPVVYIETNIRTVYFEHFFEGELRVTDSQVREVVAATLDHEHPREWYWALMDYGSWLKRNGRGSIDKSAHYKKQPALKGSLREARGLAVKALSSGSKTRQDITSLLDDEARMNTAINDLLAEGLIVEVHNRLALP